MLCCLCTTAVAAPAKKKSTKKTRDEPAVRALRGPSVRSRLPPRSSALAQPEPEILPGGVPATRAKSVIVIDARTGEVLYEKNADEHRAPASTQKLLTALIVAERGYLDQPVTVMPTDTYAEPTKLGIKAGETYRRIDLLRALLVKSPNDVARCAGARCRRQPGGIRGDDESTSADGRRDEFELS